MRMFARHPGSLFLALALSIAGCTKEPASDQPASGQTQPAPAEVEAAPVQPAVPANSAASALGAGQASSLSPQARAALDEALGAYEQLRAQLAADKTERVTEAATRLEETATRAAAVVPASLQARVQAVASAAVRLKEAQGKSPDEIRATFGEVSRAVVAMISSEPALSQGKHVYECPMAQGYKKWVQTDEAIANPYMGSRMLACGVKSTWSE